MTESRKTHKQLESSRNQRYSTTAMHTPLKKLLIEKQPKQCPYHFSQSSHICLTCRRSICLRCAITLCQQHTIHHQQQILQLLLVDLQKLTILPRIQDINLKIKQSQQRQQYVVRKMKKIFVEIEQNFECVRVMLQRKKQQILQYYEQQLANKYLGQYRKYDQQLQQKNVWLNDLMDNIHSCKSIQQIDQLGSIIKKQIAPEAMNTQVRVTRLIVGKDNMKMNKIWSQQKLQKILYQIQNVVYKLKDSNAISNTGKKKRVTTQASQSNNNCGKVSQFIVNSKSPFAGILRSTSNSRFPTNRKVEP